MRDTQRPLFERRHYEFIAEKIRCARIPEAARWELAQDFAHALGGTNPRFDAARFVAACLVKGTK